MIKLEDLKIGDKVYEVDSDGLGLCAESIVQRELCMLDALNPTECVICSGGSYIITRSGENYIFRTEQEANENLNIIRLKLGKELLRSNKFLDRLYECATSSKRLGKYDERPIFEIAIKLYNMMNI